VPWHDPRRVAAFGHPRIHAGWRLPEAFRSLPRPSSAPGAKASPVRPSLRHARSLAGAPHAGSCAVSFAMLLLRPEPHAQGIAPPARRSQSPLHPPTGNRAAAPTDQLLAGLRSATSKVQGTQKNRPCARRSAEACSDDALTGSRSGSAARWLCPSFSTRLHGTAPRLTILPDPAGPCLLSGWSRGDSNS
jgi:hypothetical protein